MHKKRVAIYTRVSTSKDEQSTSLESQELFYRDYVASREDWEFCGIYGDRTSGTKLNRPSFDALMYKCGVVVKEENGSTIVTYLDKESEIDLIVCKNTSRFCRNLEGVVILKRLRKKGVYVYFENIGKSTEEVEDELIIQLLLAIDENYSKALSKSARFGYVQAVEKRNQIYGGHTLFGYQCIKKDGQNYLVPINSDYTDLVNKIYNWYLEGYGFRTIAQMVDDMGYKSTVLNKEGNYASIGKHGIKRIITNERYMGYNQIPIRKSSDFLEIGKIERKEGNYTIRKSEYITPMVSEELWHKANNYLNKKTMHKQLKGKKTCMSKYSGKLLCGACYSKMIVADGYKGKKLYVCSKKKNNGASACCQPYISEQFLDEYIENLLKGNFIEEQKQWQRTTIFRAKNIKLAYIKNYFDNNNSETISILTKEIEQLKEKQKNLIYSFMGLAEDATKEIVNELEEEKLIKEKELDKLCITVDELKRIVLKIDMLIKELEECSLSEISSADDVLKQIDLIRSFPNQPNRTKQQRMNDVSLNYDSYYQVILEDVFYSGTQEFDLCASDSIDIELGIPKEEEESLMERYSLL